MFNIIGMIFSGLIIGALARWLYPGAVEMGWLKTIALGIGGSLLVGLIASRSDNRSFAGLNRAGCVGSVIGALVLIFIGRQVL